MKSDIACQLDPWLSVQIWSVGLLKSLSVLPFTLLMAVPVHAEPIECGVLFEGYRKQTELVLALSIALHRFELDMLGAMEIETYKELQDNFSKTNKLIQEAGQHYDEELTFKSTAALKSLCPDTAKRAG